MPTKKRKAAPKKSATKAVKSAKAPSKKASPFYEKDYTSSLMKFMLYVWSILILVYGVANVANIIQNPSADTGVLLLNYFIGVVTFVLAFVVFKTATALGNGSDDGYMGGLVSFLNIGIFGLSQMAWNGSVQPVAWGFIAFAALGLIFLLPYAGKYKKVDEHNLTTWGLVLYMLFWFAAVVLAPYAQSFAK